MKLFFKKADIIIFSVLLLVLVFSVLLLIVNRSFGSYVVVTVDGVQTNRFLLNKDGVYPVNGGTNTVVIENGTARVENADCPDKLCEHFGKIRYSGQSIICLPNKLAVSISGTEDLDFII